MAHLRVSLLGSVWEMGPFSARLGPGLLASSYGSFLARCRADFAASFSIVTPTSLQKVTMLLSRELYQPAYLQNVTPDRMLK